MSIKIVRHEKISFKRSLKCSKKWHDYFTVYRRNDFSQHLRKIEYVYKGFDFLNMIIPVVEVGRRNNRYDDDHHHGMKRLW